MRLQIQFLGGPASNAWVVRNRRTTDTITAVDLFLDAENEHPPRFTVRDQEGKTTQYEIENMDLVVELKE